jgi:hypothetical protein
MTRPSPQDMYSEMAGLAARTHWDLEVILDLEHAQRRDWLDLLRTRTSEDG